MKYLYAVLDAAAAPPSRPGLGGAAVEAVRYADLQALVSEVSQQQVAHPDGTAPLAHAAVVEHAYGSADAVLPMRFGSTVRDRPRVVAFLAGRHEEFVRGLHRVRGAVEVGIRVTSRERAGAGSAGLPTDGRTYLAGRAAARNEHEALACAVHDPLSALARAGARWPLVNGGTVLAAAYLVSRDRLPEFHRTVTGLSVSHPEAAVLCTGPWPPYSFTLPNDLDADFDQALREVAS